ncbi:hypothetical protein QYF61_020066 [Mycteria americana]|uniref:Uncharacterized protein n=1 Tax=Mycteria americana TaxID=33587 RepID=A0AAN7N327_MYCAM|nr:hypothetical protein QYF61_020066 [Mycteria americana]
MRSSVSELLVLQEASYSETGRWPDYSKQATKLHFCALQKLQDVFSLRITPKIPPQQLARPPLNCSVLFHGISEEQAVFKPACTQQPLVIKEGWQLNHFPGQPDPMLDNPFSEVTFPNIRSKPRLAQLKAISSRPITCYLGGETDPHLSTTSFQDKSHLPSWSPGHTAGSYSGSCQPTPTGPFLPGSFPATLPQACSIAIGLVEPHTIGLSPLTQPVQSLPTLKQINTPSLLGVVCKLTEGALNPFIQIIDKDIKQNWPQHRGLGDTTCDRPPTGVNSVHNHSLGPAIQPVLYPAKSTPVQAMSSQFLKENAVGNRVKGFTEV